MCIVHVDNIKSECNNRAEAERFAELHRGEFISQIKNIVTNTPMMKIKVVPIKDCSKCSFCESLKPKK